MKDPSEALISGAAVSLKRQPRGALAQTASDAQGRFRFAEVTAGSYTLHVTSEGFEPWERAVTVGDNPVDLGVSLEVKALTESVQVSAGRSPLANSDPNYIALRGGRLTKVYRVNNLALERDAGAFRFRSGSFSFLPPVLGQVTAGVFVGDGNFQLRPASDAAIKHLHRFAGVDAVNEDFTAMVVYFSDSTFDEIRKCSELVDETPQRHQEALNRIEDTLRQRREPGMLVRLTLLERLLNYEDIPNYDAETLAELYNPARRGSFRAFLHGKKHPNLRFLLNPSGALPMLPAPEEVALINFDPLSESDGVWYFSHLSGELKTSRASSNEDKRLIAPEHYKIEALIAGQNLIGKEADLWVTCELQFHALEDGTRMVKFDLVPDLQMSRVAWNGKETAFIQESRKRDGSFYLQTPEPLVRGRSYQVTFEYSGGEILQSQSGPIPPRRIWYPTPSGPASRATYDLTFRIPHSMTVVAVGKKVKQTRDGAFDISQWISDVPISQAVFKYLSDVFVKTVADESTRMKLAAYIDTGTRGLLPASRSDVLTDARNSTRIFNAWFGPPSFDSLTVLVTSTTDSLPGLVYATPAVTAGYSSVVGQVLNLSEGRSSGPGLNRRVYFDEALPRQIGHQWWGNTVGPVSFHDAWLSSGFADFSASLYDLEANHKSDHWERAREVVLKPNPGGFRANDAGPVWMGVLNDSWRMRGAGAILNAFKGGFIVNMLRSIMWDAKSGDAGFRAMMQDYVKQFTNRAASTEDFKLLLEKHIKPVMDLDGNGRMDWFFREWVYGTEIPSYCLEYSVAEKNGGKWLLTGRLTQSGVSPEFKMAVPVFAEFAGRKSRIGNMAMRGSSTRTFDDGTPRGAQADHAESQPRRADR